MFKCRICGESLSTKWNLMNHRKGMRLSALALCRNNIEGKCVYSEDMCWWNHAEKLTNDEGGLP